MHRPYRMFTGTLALTETEEDLQRHLDSELRKGSQENIASRLVESTATEYLAESPGPIA